MPKASFSLGDDSDVGFDGLSVDSQRAIAARRFVVEQDRNRVAPIPEQHHDTIDHYVLSRQLGALGGSRRGPQRIGMNEPARGSRRPHQGQKRMNAHEVGQRQRGQRSGNAECDQTRLTLRLHSGQ
jgi:hypothetical protein